MDHSLLTLHGLAVKKASSAEEIARMMDLPPDAVRATLAEAQAAGDVMGAKGKYMLTPGGRMKLDEAYPAACSILRDDPTLAAAYERFEKINRDLLDLFTRWQMISRAGESIPNDHTDRDYDVKILDQLDDLHERAGRVADRLADAVPRLWVYRDRLAAAYDHVLAGDTAYVSGVKVDSYHTVWFELHEDILRLLGRRRED